MAAPEPEIPALASAPATLPGYRPFVLGVASWFGGWGMQAVLFSWLVVGELDAPAELVGVVQTSTMLPSLLLLLFGGTLADRVDPRRLLIVLHALAVLPVLGLAAAVATGRLSIPVLVAYGISIGTIAGFAMPARDTLLSRVAGGDMMRAVTGMTAVQFGAQASGALVAGAARVAGSAPMLLVHAAVLFLGSVVTQRVPPVRPIRPEGGHRPALHDVADGVRLVLRTPALRSPIVLVMAVGFLFVGPFMVNFPLIVRDVYAGSVAQLAVVMTLFPLGTITGSMILRERGVTRKGLACLVALLCGSSALGSIGLGLPFWGFVVATALWGLAGSVFINCSRTLYQEAAPAAQRGRVLAVYQIGFLGMAPLGALSAGFVAGLIGPLATLALYAVGMASLVALLWITTDIARME